MQLRQKSMSRQTRNSGVELLKIVSIALIVISHMVQTLSSAGSHIATQDYVLNLSAATNNMQYLLVALLRYGGSFGDTVFFVCSAWFLLDNDKVSSRKILRIMMDIWTVSVAILAVVFILRKGNIGMGDMIKQFFPATFANNWYITCYLLFYPIHGFLNQIIKKVSQQTLLKTTLVMLFLYEGINYLKGGHFFAVDLILWIVIYFAVGYAKLYLPDFSDSRKANIWLVLIGIFGTCGLFFATNFLGLRMGVFSHEIYRWGAKCSPFFLMTAIGLLNLARMSTMQSKAINYVSKLSLLIYIIHDNLLLKSYYRPLLWVYVYEKFGYTHLLLWVLALSAVVFAAAFLTSALYDCTLRKLVEKVGDWLFPLLGKAYHHVEKRILKLH